MKKIFYLGPESSYSHIITQHIVIDKEYRLSPVDTFSDVIAQVKKIPHAIGVLPIENSITSDIHENIDALFGNDVSIFHEAFLKIKLHLIGLQQATTKDILTVYSHERALAQCNRFLQEHHFITTTTQSTAQGKEIVVEKQDKTNAVIGNKALAHHPQLKILAENIGNDSYNMTRFVFVSKENIQTRTDKKNKASVTFTVPHMPGSLAKLLTRIAQLHLNLTKIESRPIPGTNWEYHFWIDIESPDEALNIQHVNNLFQKNTLSYRIIGIYPSGEIFES